MSQGSMTIRESMVRALAASIEAQYARRPVGFAGNDLTRWHAEQRQELTENFEARNGKLSRPETRLVGSILRAARPAVEATKGAK